MSYAVASKKSTTFKDSDSENENDAADVDGDFGKLAEELEKKQQEDADDFGASAGQRASAALDRDTHIARIQRKLAIRDADLQADHKKKRDDGKRLKRRRS